ncbi:AN1-type zinc finger protein 1-like [Ruditapes philippinarum]|uniref:AN1-type zinc finger protein 1-like n=1 Tax=Ruditapes philippinarum TaxID=129788 RepID=UPI00295B732C|nr:AN1-type zinc finger protein 1-like [Ruditapes philippinarum]
MAELPDLGKHCNFEHCKQLDFLPFGCDGCGNTFCSEHRTKDAHSCSKDMLTSAGCEYTGARGYTCSLTGCSNRELTEIFCDKCQQVFCLSHRHAQDHDCSKLKEELVNTGSKTAEHVNQIIASKSVVVKKSRVSAKSSKTAAKVALMKMKMHAKGDSGCPETERVYLRVYPPSQYNKEPQPMFFSKTWSIGRTVDSIASRLGIQNNNNVQTAKKLRLFSTDDGTVLQTDCHIEMLLKQELIFNGSSVILEYVHNNTEILDHLSVYKIS